MKPHKKKKVRFVFVNDEGKVFGSADAPTPEDLLHARTGVVNIIRVSDLSWYGRKARWRPLPPSELSEIQSDEIPEKAKRILHMPVGSSVVPRRRPLPARGGSGRGEPGEMPVIASPAGPNRDDVSPGSGAAVGITSKKNPLPSL